MQSHTLARCLLDMPDLPVQLIYNEVSAGLFEDDGTGAWELGAANPTGVSLSPQHGDRPATVLITMEDAT